MQVRCWRMEWTSWSFLRKPAAQMARRASMTTLPLVSPTTRPARLSWPWASVWWSPRSAVSSCPNSP